MTSDGTCGRFASFSDARRVRFDHRPSDDNCDDRGEESKRHEQADHYWVHQSALLEVAGNAFAPLVSLNSLVVKRCPSEMRSTSTAIASMACSILSMRAVTSLGELG